MYLLHGSGDDQTGWVQFGEVLQIADKAIREGSATPMIIVMPDANTGKRGYFNDIRGDWRYEDFFFKELMPFVERISESKRISITARSQDYQWVAKVHLFTRSAIRNCFLLHVH